MTTFLFVLPRRWVVEELQMFADLNKHAVRPSPSISTLYDHRDQQSEMARFVVQTVPVFSRLTEKENPIFQRRGALHHQRY